VIWIFVLFLPALLWTTTLPYHLRDLDFVYFYQHYSELQRCYTIFVIWILFTFTSITPSSSVAIPSSWSGFCLLLPALLWTTTLPYHLRDLDFYQHYSELQRCHTIFVIWIFVLFLPALLWATTLPHHLRDLDFYWSTFLFASITQRSSDVKGKSATFLVSTTILWLQLGFPGFIAFTIATGSVHAYPTRGRVDYELWIVVGGGFWALSVIANSRTSWLWVVDSCRRRFLSTFSMLGISSLIHNLSC
jgi:hypothetical protein